MAPLQNMSLFGGALNLDLPTSDKVNGAIRGGGEKGMEVEEAASVLLAFSSPETMQPISSGFTPMMTPIVHGLEGRARRSTLDGEDFVLDGGVFRSTEGRKATVSTTGSNETQRIGKTARDILRM